MRLVLIVLICLSMAVLCANTLWDNNLKVRGSVSAEWNSASAAIPDGGMLYVWTDTRANDRDVCVQRISPSGNPVWVHPKFVDNKQGIQKNPMIISTSDGNYVVAWIDYYGGYYGNIYLQKISPDGERLWQEGGIRVTNGDFWNTEPKLVADNLGGVIITWCKNDDPDIFQYAQSYGATGNRRWQVGGIEITNITYYLITSILPDGNNGFYISYSSDYDPQSRVYLNRFDGNGYALWNAPVCIGDSLSMNRAAPGWLTVGGGAVYMAWNFYDGYSNTALMQKFSFQGTAMWQQPIEIETGEEFYDDILEMVYSEADDTVLLSLLRSGEDVYLHLLKISTSGTILWSDAEPVDHTDVSYSSYSASIKSDGQGGCYIVWSCYPDQQDEPEVFAKHYNSAGSNTWQTGGVHLGDSTGWQSKPNLTVSGDQIWASWYVSYDVNSGIRYQLLSNEGVIQLEPDGRNIISGLQSMYTEGKLTLARSNDMALVWDDDRISQDCSQIYLQGINPDGSVDYDVDGIPITTYTGHNQYLMNAKALPNDQIVIIWQEARYGSYDLFAQLISPAGARLWGDCGIRLSSFDSGWSSSTSITSDGTNVILGWTHFTSSDTNYIGTVFLQKISGGQKQWSEFGLSVIQDSSIYDNRLLRLEEDYIVYSKRDPAVNYNTDLYVLRYDLADGNPEPGWNTIGRSVSIPTTVPYIHRYFKDAHITDQGLFILYLEDNSEQGDMALAQTFSPDGQRLMEPTGTLLLDTIADFSFTLTDCGEDDFAFMWNQADSNPGYNHLARFDYNLTPLWDDFSIELIAAYGYYAKMERFSDGTLAIIWRSEQGNPTDFVPATLDYQFVSPDGEYNPATAYIITTHQPSIYNLESAAVSDRILLTWADGSSYYRDKDEPIEHVNLWAQMIDRETSSVSDPDTDPSAEVSLKQNYPNPFTTSTSICFELQKASSVKLNIFNLRGQKVRTLLNEESQPGVYYPSWDGCDALGNKAASGIYLYRLSTGSGTFIKRMMLLR
jgi:hypothetical protein